VRTLLTPVLSFGARPNDAIAIAFGTPHQSRRITRVAMLQNAHGPAPVNDSEYVFELDYAFVPVPGGPGPEDGNQLLRSNP
jgi:hypothetical protein